MFSSILATIVSSRFGPVLLGYATPETEETLRKLGAASNVTGQAALGFGPGAQAALSKQLTESGVPAGQVKQLVDAVTRAAHESFIGGLHTVFLITGIIVIVGGLLAFFIRQPKTRPDDTETPTTTV